MSKSVIVDALRSPIGLKNGEMIGIRPDDLAAQVVKGLMERNPTIKTEMIEDVVVGCAYPEGPQGHIIGKSVGVLAGLPIDSTGKVINRFCGSSMDAAHQISTAAECGDIDAGVAVGVEDMFAVPMGGFAPDFHPELAEQEFYIGMGETAENLANDLDISREDQEEFAMNSHRKALKAYEEGKFDQELVSIDVNGEATVNKDDGPREPDVEKIKSLSPAFLENGTVTAATSSPISVGAAALIVANESFCSNNDLSLWYIVACTIYRMGKGVFSRS